MNRSPHVRSSWFLGVTVFVAICMFQRTDANAAPEPTATTPCDRLWGKLDLHEGGVFVQYYRAWKALESSEDIKGYFMTLPDGARRMIVKRSDYGNVETWTFNRRGELIPQGSDKEGVLVVCQPPDPAIVNWKGLAPDVASKVKLQCRLTATSGADPVPRWLILALSVSSSDGGTTPILATLESRSGKPTRCQLPR